jgi:16S rRNA (adenine1518-N6/adenine1519-N6)-dimethyltransferase
MARQRLGQHFLGDPAWREQIARAIRVSPQSLAPRTPAQNKDFCWIEIGAGHGEMTSYLAAGGAPVYAIELDTSLASHLRDVTRLHANVTIVSGDVLRTDVAELAAGRRVRVYGNLPYYITSPILHHLFTFAPRIDEIHMVVQTEVAERLAAQPGSKLYGYLSVATQLYSRPEFVFRIPRGAFLPPPDVGSALVTLRFPGQRVGLKWEEQAAFLEFVKLCFSQKRKTVLNNLRSIVPRDRIREALGAEKLRSDSRAEQLSVQNFVSLYKKINT